MKPVLKQMFFQFITALAGLVSQRLALKGATHFATAHVKSLLSLPFLKIVLPFGE